MKAQRFYRIGNMTIQLKSELPIHESTYHLKFKAFETDGPGEDNIAIRHIFSNLELDIARLGKSIFLNPPWGIYRIGSHWIYVCIGSGVPRKSYPQIGIFNADFSDNCFYNNQTKKKLFQEGGITSLSLMPTDQLLLAQALALRKGCYFHASGIIYNRQGLLFMGHSGAGKSTIVSLLRERVEILCDDRIIVREIGRRFNIFGTWSHGDIPLISPSSAPLKAMLFLEKSTENKLVPLTDSRQIIGKLLAFLIKPFPTQAWWLQSLTLLERIASRVPAYYLNFRKDSGIISTIKDLVK